MTDKTHLEELTLSLSDMLAKKLVAVFVDGHRNPLLSAADVVTRLKDEMEQSLTESADAAPLPDRS